MPEASVKIAFLVGVVALVSVIIAALVYNQPERRVNRLLDLGQKYLAEENYEQAVAKYKLALEIEPKNEKAISGAVTAYLGWSDQLVAAEDYEKAEEVLTEGCELIDDQQLQDALQEVEQLIQLAEYKDELDGLLTQVISLCDAADYDGAYTTLIESDVFSAIARIGLDKYIYQNSSGTSAGIYDGQYLYCGGYDGDVRSGYGVWFVWNIYYIGDWSNDMPNGAQEMHYIMQGDSRYVFTQDGSAVSKVLTGDVVDGLWDGPVTETSESDSWHYTYDNGIIQVIRVSEGSEAPYCVAEEEMGVGLASSWWSEEMVQETHGVMPFADWI